jgi:cytochrome P450
MGLGLDDADFFVDAVHRLSGNSGGGDDAAGRMMAAWADIAGYWTRVLADRREHPLDPAVDFVTHLTNGKLGDRPMPDLDIVDVLVTLTLGSLDNLKIQLSWALWHLATTPVDRERIVADPSLIPGAVEEFLRVFPIVSMARKLTTDIDFHGCPMKKNDMVLLQIQSATRDPRVFPDADKVIIDRSPNRHMAFGISEHRCLGSHLARAEMMVALEEWNRAIPDYRIDPDAPPLEAIGGQIALPSLPLVWDVAASSAGE